MFKSVVSVAAIAFAAQALSGCAATGVAISKRNLDVQTRMSESIFLDPPAPNEMTILVQVRNTSDKPDFTVQPNLERALTGRGWTVVRDPGQAQYMLQANVLQVGKTDPSAAQQLFRAGYGGMLPTGVLGAAAAYSMGSGNGRTIAGVGLLAGATEFVAGQIVKDVYFSAITDVQVSRRSRTKVKSASEQHLRQGSSGAELQTYVEDSEWRRYRTRVLSSANKVNLRWEEAESELVRGLTHSISGLF